MFGRHKMIISMNRNGIKSSREVRTFRSCSGMLKHLKKQVKQIDPYTRIMELSGVPTLVIHRTGMPDMVTVRLVDEGTKQEK